jgi:chemotaxis protein MotB
MKKSGTGLWAVLAGILMGPALAGAADLPPVDMPDEANLPSDPVLPSVNMNASAGFVRPPTPYDALVSQVTGDNQTTGNKRLLGGNDQIYLELQNLQETAPGDKFTLYRRVKKVYHPSRGHYLGDLTAVLGTVKVLRVTGRKATVKVERSYDAIYPGDGAMRQTAPEPAPASSGQSLPDGTGMIVELPPGQTLIGQWHVVYVDWGRNDGVKIGDQLLVFRASTGIPIQIIGELKVIAVEDRTATARVVRSTAPLLRGDRFASKDTLQKQLGVDVSSITHSRREALFQEMTPTPAAAAPMAGGGEMAQEAHAVPHTRDIERELAELARQLEFDPGNAPATDASQPILKKMKALLREAPDSRLVVEGYTDSQGIGPSLKELYKSNQELSRARAAAVAAALSEEGGIDPGNVSVVGRADTKPVASNSTEAGRKKNRRIEIRLIPASPAPATPAPSAP